MSHTNKKRPTSNLSEIKAIEQITEIFEEATPGCRVLSNIILRTTCGIDVCPATAEYDIIVVCRYGLIHFEVKGWCGDYLYNVIDRSGSSRWMIRFAGSDQVEERRNALKQCAAKTKMLRQELGVWTQHCVLFTDANLQIAPNMSPYLFNINELSYVPRFLRMKHKEGSEKLLDQRTINAIAETLVEASAGLSPEKHLKNIHAYLEHKKAGKSAHAQEPSSKRSTAPVKQKAILPANESDICVQLHRDPDPLAELLIDYPSMRQNQIIWHMSKHLSPLVLV